MAQFILLYKGPPSSMTDITTEPSDIDMKNWQDWMDELGLALIEMGSPMKNGIAINDDGSEGLATELTGYSIIEANDIEEAKKLVENHPFLSDKTGDCAIEIFELQSFGM